MPAPLILKGSLTVDERAVGPFLYLPFEVPAGVTRLDVRYEYSPGHILDIGLFDPSLEPFPSQRGFRGWSGGARTDFFVATDDATPGYLPGAIAPGSWRVVLGLAQVAATPCQYHVEVTFSTDVRPSVNARPPWPEAQANARWYRGDLQSHTHHSDATGSLDDLCQAARARGLEFLAVTDHNTCSHHPHLAAASSPEFLLLPGEEVTTYKGHANVWGIEGWVDFRLESENDLPALLEQVAQRGGVFSVNHPKMSPGCIGCDWSYPVPEAADCFEVWQGPWWHRNWESLARYDAQLALGRRLTLVGGSDRHQPGWPDATPSFLQVGSPTTWLHLEELSSIGVLDALQSGRSFVSESPEGPQLEIRAANTSMGGTLAVVTSELILLEAKVTGAAGDILWWVSASGCVRELIIGADTFHDQWEWSAASPYIRAEIHASTEKRRHASDVFQKYYDSGKVPMGLSLQEIKKRPLMRALSNPIYMRLAS